MGREMSNRANSEAQAASESDRVWSWYTGAGLTVVERINRVDHKLQQAVPELGVALP